MSKAATQHLLIWWPQGAPNAVQHAEVYYEVHNTQGLCLHSGQAPLQNLHRCPWQILGGPVGVPPVLVLLHPADVLLLAVDLPSAQGRKLDAALPYMVEPAILNTPEDNHVTHWLLAANTTQTMAAVVTKALVAEVLTQCRAAHLACQTVSCESLRNLRVAEPVLSVQGEHVLWIDGQAPPLCVPLHPPEIARHLLAQRCLAEPSNAPAPKVRRVYAVGTASRSSKIGKIIKALLPEGVVVDTLRSLTTPDQQSGVAVLDPCLHLLKKSLVPSQAAAALGFHAIQHHSPMALRFMAGGAMALLLCWVVGLQVAAWHTNNRQQQLEQQVAQRFQEVLPNTPMVADPLLLIERELKQSTGMQSNHATAEQGLLLALQTVAKNMPEVPSHTLKRIALEGKGMQLAFAIAVSPETQNRVATALQAQGYSVAWERLGNEGVNMNSLGTPIGTSLLRIQNQETP